MCPKLRPSAHFSTGFEDTLSAKWGRSDFDFLINNAGIGIYAPFANITEAQFDDLMKIYFRSPFFLTQKLLPLLKDGGADSEHLNRVGAIHHTRLRRLGFDEGCHGGAYSLHSE